MSGSSNNNLLARARAGDQEALGELLRTQNQVLERMARKEVEGRLQARLSATDLVQQTCLSAIRSFEDFQGESELQFAAWLRGVHERNVRDAVRQHVHAKKRAVAAQVPLDDGIAPSVAPQTASRKAMLSESNVQLNQALASLPETQAEAVRLPHLDQLSLKEIASRMGSTDVAVASLIKRGLSALRDRLPTDQE